MGKLDGKVAVVTGGAGGIGLSSADLFAEEGAKVVIVDMNEEKGKQAEQSLKENYVDILFIQANVTDQEHVKNIFETTVSTFGKVDILFNNAGIGSPKPTEDLSYEEWRNTVGVDLDGIFLVAQAAIKEFLKQGDGGIIVNTASMYGWVGAPGNVAYNAAKGGVINLTRSLGLEYAERNIRVNALCPGYIATDILGETDRKILEETTPMKRLGTSEEIAKAVLFMASDDSSFMTGNSITVDGGYTAQ